MMREHPEAYSARAQVQLQVRTLPDQIASPARTILLVLLAAAAVVFVIACSNVASLILARSVRREGELALRAALGAGRGGPPAHPPRGEPGPLCRGRRAGPDAGRAAPDRCVPLCRALFRPRARSDGGRGRALARRGAGGAGCPCCSPTFHGSRHPIVRPGLGLAGGLADHARNPNRRHANVCDDPDRVLVRAAGGRRHAGRNAHGHCRRRDTGYDMRQVLAIDVPPPATGVGGDAQRSTSSRKPRGASASCRACRVSRPG